MLNRTLIFLFLIVVAAPAGFSADVSVRAGVDKNRVTIGDPVVLNVSVTLPETYRLAAPQKPAELGPWTVKDVRAAKDEKDRFLTHIIYTLAAFTTGQTPVPPVTLTYTDDKNKTYTLHSDTVPVTVESVMARAGDANDIRDIKPPLGVREPLWKYLLWAGIILAAAIIGYILYRGYRKKHVPPAAPAQPLIPPYDLAMTRLEELRTSGMIAEGKIKEYYITLSDIVRDYLGAVYAIETRESTTAEIYARLRGKESDMKRLQSIRDLFDECDLVKFAKYRPDEQACAASWEAAKNIVNFKSQI